MWGEGVLMLHSFILSSAQKETYKILIVVVLKFQSFRSSASHARESASIGWTGSTIASQVTRSKKR